MQFSSYEAVPGQIAEEIIKERVGAGKVRGLDAE